jgi:hypothetical protein
LSADVEAQLDVAFIAGERVRDVDPTRRVLGVEPIRGLRIAAGCRNTAVAISPEFGMSGTRPAAPAQIDNGELWVVGIVDEAVEVFSEQASPDMSVMVAMIIMVTVVVAVTTVVIAVITENQIVVLEQIGNFKIAVPVEVVVLTFGRHQISFLF